MDLTLTLVILSGLFAGVSPCALAVYPLVIHMLSKERKNSMLILLFFCLGMFGTIASYYFLLGLIAAIYGGAISGELEEFRAFLYLPAGAYLLAYSILGGFPFLLRGFNSKGVEGQGLIPSFFKGVFFSFLATSCSLPYMVTGILPAFTAKKTFFSGFAYVIVFSFAFILPLFIFGVFQSHIQQRFDTIRRNQMKVEGLGRLLLFVAGLYFIWEGITIIFL
ncbi:MAG: cytochrome c biogenesis protein CcdA [Candidatus Altiarchaeota archaeon]